MKNRHLNPFDQYLVNDDYSKIEGRFDETPFFEDYKKQLADFFDKVNFVNLTVDLEKGMTWIVYKK